MATGLTETERAFVEAARHERGLVLEPSDPEDSDPRLGFKWPIQRVVRAEVIRGLLLQQDDDPQSVPRVVQLFGARIEGELDLSGANVRSRLVLNRCYIPHGIRLDAARFETLDLEGSFIRGLRLFAATATGGIVLKGVVAEGRVELSAAQIKGAVVCASAKFSNLGDVAFAANGAEISGGLFSGQGLAVVGAFQLRQCRIQVQWTCSGGTFSNIAGEAIDAFGVTVEGSLLLHNAVINGQVNLDGAVVTGAMSFSGATIRGYNGIAVVARHAAIRGDALFLQPFTCEGGVVLASATIEGVLSFLGARVDNAGGSSIDITNSRITRGVYLARGFQSRGRLSLSAARIEGHLILDDAVVQSAQREAVFLDATHIDGDLSCARSRIEGETRCIGVSTGGGITFEDTVLSNPTDIALSADSARIGRSVYLTRLRATGSVLLPGCVIEGQVSCLSAKLEAPGATALSLSDSSISRTVLCSNGFDAIGRVRMDGLRVGLSLSFRGGSIESPGQVSLDLTGANVGGELDLATRAPIRGVVDLTNADVAALRDDPSRYADQYLLDGFSYSQLGAVGHQVLPVGVRLRWIEDRSAGGGPGPYNQLAAAYARSGDDRAARRVLLEKQRMFTRERRSLRTIWGPDLGCRSRLRISASPRAWMVWSASYCRNRDSWRRSSSRCRPSEAR